MPSDPRLAVDDAPAYVLHHRPWRESSLLLELLVFGLGRVGAIVRGVRGPRANARRAVLQPLQPLKVSLQRRGELYLLNQFEAASAPLMARGDAVLAALYLNELCVRLLPRDEAVDGFFLDYARSVAALAEGAALPGVLRRCEFALLAASGYAIGDHDVDGAPLRSDRFYLHRGDGLVGVGERHPGAVAGSALIALRDDDELPAAQQSALRRLLREALQARPGNRPLRCWGLLDELAAVGSRAPTPGSPDPSPVSG